MDTEALENLLVNTEYDAEKTAYLINGFREGFDIGYVAIDMCKEMRLI